MIEVEHLTKYYGPNAALRDVTFNVEQGEILGFLGPNGAGKTTTMRIITGYLPPSSGTARVAGFDVAEKSLDARRHLGYLPEMVPLYTDLTTYEYLDFRGRLCGLHHGRERKARIYEVMDQLNLGDVSNRLIGQLSRGYRQRVGLAQALIHNPDALILDEPTVGLDPVQITEVRNLIKELGKNHTIILSTHLLPEVSMVCDRVVIINRGRLVALDTPLHLMQSGAQSQTVRVEVAGRPTSILETLRGVPAVEKAVVLQQAVTGDGVAPEGAAVSFASESSLPEGSYQYQVEGKVGSEIRPELAAAVIGAGYELLEMRSVRLSLEDIFLRVIAQGAEEDEDELADEFGGEDTLDEDLEPEAEVVRPRMRTRPTPTEAASTPQTVRVAGRRVRR
ncbi:MAG: ABC transporter ATP-binding protein [Chloroflexia bacterium]